MDSLQITNIGIDSAMVSIAHYDQTDHFQLLITIYIKSFKKGQQLSKNLGFLKIPYFGSGTAVYIWFFNKCSFV